VLTLHIVVDDADDSLALADRVTRVPGVSAAGFISVLPLQHVNWSGRFTIEGRPFEGTAQFRYVTPGYFEALGVPLIAGRSLSALDTSDAPRVVLVNDAFAREFLPGEPAVGHRLTDRGIIVGIVGNVRQSSLDQPAIPEIYYPVAQNFAQLRSVGSVLVVRSTLPPESLLPSIRAAIREVSPDQATFRVATMERVVDESLGGRRFYLWLIGAFAIVGTALAAAGTYSVIAYLVAIRTREFGIRVALGADSRRIIRLVVGRGAWLVGLGLGIGCVGALMLTRFLQALLYGVTSTDLPTFVAVGVTLFTVAVAACIAPARRATRVDPAVALRVE
jgi:predicted permease